MENNKLIEKICITCNILKDISMFYKNKTCKDGVSNVCIECVKNREINYRNNNKEKINKRKKEYYKNNKKRLIAYRTKYKKLNPEKEKLWREKYYHTNKKKILKYGNLYNKKNKKRAKNNNLLRIYGISLDDLKNMIKKQDNKCLICTHELNTEKKYKENIDHCHKTGKVRGILCNRCNLMIGSVEENINILQNAIQYLIKFNNK